jgi:peptide/nickel transport system permease protein
VGQLALGIDHPLAPSARHLLGTDPWGRDILSQLLYSSQFAFVLGGLAGLIAVLLGLGAALAVRALERKWLKRLGNGLLALGCGLLTLPLIPLFILLSAFVELDLHTMALWIGLLLWPLVLFILQSKPELLERENRPGRSKVLAGTFLYIMAISIGIEAVLSFWGLTNIQMSWGLMVEMANISGYLVGPAVTQQWWLFWPASLGIWLFEFTALLLGWELKGRA